MIIESREQEYVSIGSMSKNAQKLNNNRSTVREFTVPILKNLIKDVSIKC